MTEATNLNYNKCFLCDKTHRLDDCPMFLSKRLDDRRAFVKSNDICFGCLRTGHRSRFCRKRIICKTCTKEHPTSLHGDVALNFNNRVDTRTSGVLTKDTEKHTRTSHLIDARNGNMSSLILPVWVSHVDTPGKEVLTYALLDAQSDTTFVADNTCDALGIEGCETQLTLSTISAKNQVIKRSRVDGLVVRGYNNASKVFLPVAFTRSTLPVNRYDIPNPEVAQQWLHLKHIANELMPVSEYEVGLLIGYNCPKALVPREVIPPVHNSPYAQKTDLGWGIVGNLNPDMTELSDHDAIGVSKCILAYEVPQHVLSEVDGENSKVHVNLDMTDHCTTDFCICRTICLVQIRCISSIRHMYMTDFAYNGPIFLVPLSPSYLSSPAYFNITISKTISPVQSTQMMQSESHERNLNDDPCSQEDSKFLSVLKDGVYQLDNCHYKMPLPFDSPEPELQNNRNLAIYPKNYNSFMHEIISKD